MGQGVAQCDSWLYVVFVAALVKMYNDIHIHMSVETVC